MTLKKKGGMANGPKQPARHIPKNPLLEGSPLEKERKSIQPTMVVDSPELGHEQQSPMVTDQSFSSMSAEGLISIAVSECKKHGVSDKLALMENEDLKPIFLALFERNLLKDFDVQLKESTRQAQTRQIGISGAKSKPPPLPAHTNSSYAPVSVKVTTDQISGVEETIAAVVSSSDQQTSEKEFSMAADRVSNFILKMEKDETREPKETLERYEIFYHSEIKNLFKYFGPDEEQVREIISEYQSSVAKKRENGEKLSEVERYINTLDDLSRHVDLHQMKVDKLADFHQFKQDQQDKKRTSKEPATPDPISSREPTPGNKPKAEVQAKVPSPERKSPGRASKPPSPDQAAESPKEDEKENGGSRKSKPPSGGDSQEQKASLFARFMLSPFTWAIAGVGVFSAAMYATSGFNDLGDAINLGMGKIPPVATYIRQVWEGWLHLPRLESPKGAADLYYGLSGISVLAGVYLKYRKVQKRSNELEQLGVEDKHFQEMCDYVRPILIQITEEYNESTIPEKIRDTMIDNEKFFIYMDEFHSNPQKFLYLMDTAQVPKKVVKSLYQAFAAAESRIIKKKLRNYVKNIDDPEIRMKYLRESNETDPVLSGKLKEIFYRNAVGDLVNKKMQTDLQVILDDDLDKGRAIFRKLEMDYFRLTEMKK